MARKNRHAPPFALLGIRIRYPRVFHVAGDSDIGSTTHNLAIAPMMISEEVDIAWTLHILCETKPEE